MTYLLFLTLFVVGPSLLLAAWARPRRREWLAIGAVIVIAYLWTTPWDNYLVASGVWYYDPDLVIGLVLGWVPLEEYLFFGWQVILVSTWTLGLRRLMPAPRPRAPAAGSAALLIAPVALASGLPPLGLGRSSYLVLILAWAVPVIAGQIALGWPAFRANWKVWLMGALIPAIYLTAADSVALAAGTWTIAPEQSLGWLLPGGVPIEEGVFFLVTSLMSVQGLLLFLDEGLLARARQLWQRP